MEVGQSGRIAIIPARGGSKRIHKKNIIDFFGGPMIAWTIKAALTSGLFDGVYVNTDDEEIADIAKSFGADVPFLRKAHADDFSPVSLATVSFARELKLISSFNVVVQLMANCPLRSALSIQSLVASFESDTERNAVISAMPFGMFNPWWAHEQEIGGGNVVLFPEAMNGRRSQDLPLLLCPTGATWVSTWEKLENDLTFYSRNYRLFDIGWEEGVDIDDEEDLRFARAVFLLRKAQK